MMTQYCKSEFSVKKVLQELHTQVNIYTILYNTFIHIDR